MLDQLRYQAMDLLAGPSTAVLASSGPAGPQASLVRCAGWGLTLYLVLSDTSNHLENLTPGAEVVVVGDNWTLRGVVRQRGSTAGMVRQSWQVVVEVAPDYLYAWPGPGRPAEMIDFNSLIPVSFF